MCLLSWDKVDMFIPLRQSNVQLYIYIYTKLNNRFQQALFNQVVLFYLRTCEKHDIVNVQVSRLWIFWISCYLTLIQHLSISLSLFGSVCCFPLYIFGRFIAGIVAEIRINVYCICIDAYNHALHMDQFYYIV